MNYILLIMLIGSICIMAGLAIIALTVVSLRNNRARNIATGIISVLIGASLIWLSSQGNTTLYIDIGISDKQFGFLLVGFVMALFILRGVMDIREGSRRLKDKTLPSFVIFKGRCNCSGIPAPRACMQ